MVFLCRKGRTFNSISNKKNIKISANLNTALPNSFEINNNNNKLPKFCQVQVFIQHLYPLKLSLTNKLHIENSICTYPIFFCVCVCVTVRSSRCAHTFLYKIFYPQSSQRTVTKPISSDWISAFLPTFLPLLPLVQIFRKIFANVICSLSAPLSLCRRKIKWNAHNT